MPAVVLALVLVVSHVVLARTPFGRGRELAAVAAAVLGVVSLFGGRGSVLPGVLLASAPSAWRGEKSCRSSRPILVLLEPPPAQGAAPPDRARRAASPGGGEAVGAGPLLIFASGGGAIIVPQGRPPAVRIRRVASRLGLCNLGHRRISGVDATLVVAAGAV